MGQAERDRFLKYHQVYRSSGVVNSAVLPPEEEEDTTGTINSRNNKANSTRENRFGKSKHSKPAMKKKNSQKTKKGNQT